ncbi:hypothetical protein SeMB42_g03409 [Synchytrium endobioticum]|uniref:CYRIA/CYRIB Rac1 binding domain-containing protein n=1 Tax=Synchytrium endobioticum TaxID=286115 RepID=A0A507D6K0_9FUNG|nr:hypothetical protein SeLEV6574_g05224 [Synchytrium endobioticum]TPX47239.1 hypothetical protein SeMB42_g03409 [Synchytrium endobioticum]
MPPQTLDSLRLAEHLTLLNKHARGLIESLCSAKVALDSDTSSTSEAVQTELTSRVFSYNDIPLTVDIKPRIYISRPRFLVDSGLAAVVKAMTKKFPESADATKVSGFNIFQATHKEIMDELRAFYEILLSCVDFVEQTLPLLQQATSWQALSFETVPDIASGYLNLLVSYVSILYLCAALGPDRKAIVTGYAKAWSLSQSLQGVGEPHFSRISKFIIAYEKPLYAIQESLTGTAPRIVQLLVALKNDVDMRLSASADMFRRTATLSLTPELSGIKAPEPDPKHLLALQNMNRQFTVLMIGFLCCPGELNKNSQYLDLIRSTLTYGYLIPLGRSEMMSIMTEYAQTATDWKIPKLKQAACDTLANLYATIPVNHRERRDYLRHQVRQLLALCEDEEILFAKLPMISAGVAFAKEEIVWYWSHYDRDVTGKRPTKKKDNKHMDLQIFELMWLVKALAKKLQMRKQQIQYYCAHFLENRAARAIESIQYYIKAGNNVPASVQNMLRAIADALGTITSNNWDVLSMSGELAALRLNWMRFQASVAHPDAPSPPPNLADLVSHLPEVTQRSVWLDDFDKTLSDISDFRTCYFHQNALHEHLKECMDHNPDQLRFCGILGTLGEDFLRNVTPYWPMEFNALTSNSVLFTSEVYTLISAYAAHVADEVALSSVIHQRQLFPAEAVNALPKDPQQQKRRSPTRKTAEKDATRRPGWESDMQFVDASVKRLEACRTMLRNLIFATKSSGVVTVHDSEFYPVSFLLDALAAKVKSRLQSFVYISVPGSAVPYATFAHPDPSGSRNVDEIYFEVKRPSVFLAELNAYLHGLHIVNELLGVECTNMLQDVLMEQVDVDKCRSFIEAQAEQYLVQINSRDAKQAKKGALRNMNISQPILLTYAVWFGDFFTTKLSTGVFYSSSKKSFVSKHSAPFQAELYIDQTELRALCHILGPRGIRFIDERLLKMVTLIVTYIKETLVSNHEAVERFRLGWNDDARAIDMLRRFKFIKEFLSRCLLLGAVLEMRKLLGAASSDVLMRSAPHLHHLIRTVHTAYPQNLYELPNFKAVDTLANDVGMMDQVDVGLNGVLKAFCNNPAPDFATWSLLPFLFAATFWHLAFDEGSVYNFAVDGLENNGHTLATVFNTVCVSTIALTARQEPSAITNAHKDFLTATATLLIRLRLSTEKELQTKYLDPVFLVLKKYMDETRCISADVAEHLIPNTLIQSIIAAIHRKRIEGSPTRRLSLPGNQMTSGEQELA